MLAAVDEQRLAACKVAACQHYRRLSYVFGCRPAAAQVEQVFANLTKAVESVGGKLSDIIKTTVYVVGKENSDAIRAARAGRFGDKPPTSTLLVVKGLARPEYLVEADAIAVLQA